MPQAWPIAKWAWKSTERYRRRLCRVWYDLGSNDLADSDEEDRERLSTFLGLYAAALYQRSVDPFARIDSAESGVLGEQFELYALAIGVGEIVAATCREAMNRSLGQ